MIKIKKDFSSGELPQKLLSDIFAMHFFVFLYFVAFSLASYKKFDIRSNFILLIGAL